MGRCPAIKAAREQPPRAVLGTLRALSVMRPSFNGPRTWRGSRQKDGGLSCRRATRNHGGPVGHGGLHLGRAATHKWSCDWNLVLIPFGRLWISGWVSPQREGAGCPVPLCGLTRPAGGQAPHMPSLVATSICVEEPRACMRACVHACHGPLARRCRCSVGGASRAPKPPVARPLPRGGHRAPPATRRWIRRAP